jgi:pimeloyl-ACP methyl ester carboxylesterase
MLAMPPAMPPTAPTTVHTLRRDGGTLAYTDHGGTGRVVLCLPSLGDTAAEYRFLTPRLQQAGYRVLTADLRGHGLASTGFAGYTPEAMGMDILAILDHARIAKATLVTCSFSSAMAVVAATEQPQRFTGIVMIGPVVRETAADPYLRPLLPLLMARPWGAALWSYFYKKLYPVHQPGDLAGYAADLKRHLAEPGRLTALLGMMRASKAGVAARLPELAVPTLVMMGSRDPDHADPAAEATRIAGTVAGPAATAIVPEAGHYPHVEQGDVVAARIADFLGGS